MTKRLAVLGSTGSIGTQTLDVARRFPDRLSVIGLAAGSNTRLLEQQIAEFHPRFVSSPTEIATPRCQHLSMEEMAAHPEVDIVVIATPGGVALTSVVAAVQAGKIIALSNKESLVSAGNIMMAAAKKSGAEIRPVDSEHSAIWQCLSGETGTPSRLILTASGGPFRGYSQAELAQVTAEQALQHPSWRMGRKVTIDSATLMNKGLEVIEAHHLFNMPYDSIEVVIHHQSIVHSLVEFADGAVKAQLSPPDMRLPIQYALSYPERWGNNKLPGLDLIKTKQLDFEAPDYARFPCLRLALEAGKKGGTYPAVLCAADEVAVTLFLEGRLKFTGIPVTIEKVLSTHQAVAQPSLEEVLAADLWARTEARRVVEKGIIRC